MASVVPAEWLAMNTTDWGLPHVDLLTARRWSVHIYPSDTSGHSAPSPTNQALSHKRHHFVSWSTSSREPLYRCELSVLALLPNTSHHSYNYRVDHPRIETKIIIFWLEGTLLPTPVWRNWVRNLWSGQRELRYTNSWQTNAISGWAVNMTRGSGFRLAWLWGQHGEH